MARRQVHLPVCSPAPCDKSSALSSPKPCHGHLPRGNLGKAGLSLSDLCLRKQQRSKKPLPSPMIVYQLRTFTAAILKRRNSFELLLYPWLQPLNQTYSQTFSFTALLSFSRVSQKPGLWCLATQKPKEASTKPANTIFSPTSSKRQNKPERLYKSAHKPRREESDVSGNGTRKVG